MAVRILRGRLCCKRQVHITPPMTVTSRALPMSSSASTLSSLDDEDDHNNPPKKSILRSLGKHSSILHHFQRDASFLRRLFEEKRWDSNLEQTLEKNSSSIPPLSDGLIVEVLKTLSEARLSLRFFIWTIENKKVSPTETALGVISRRWCHEKRFYAFLKTLQKACLHGYESMDSSDFSKLLMGYGWAGMAEKAIQTLELMQSLLANNIKRIESGEKTIGITQSSVEKANRTIETVQAGPEIPIKTLEVMHPLFCSCDNAAQTLGMGQVVPIQIVAPEASHFLIVLDILEREKLFDIVPAIYSKMVDAGFFPDQETYKKLISGLCIAGHKEKARQLLDDMKTNGFRPEPETYRIVLSMFSKANKVVEVLMLFNEILEDGIEPDAKACNALVKAFCLDGKVQEGLEVVEMMLVRGLNPNLVSLNMVVEGLFDLSKLDEVFALWKKLNESSVPTLTFHHRLVIELSKAGKLSMAELVLQDIKKKSLTLPEDVRDAFVNGLSKAGRIAKVQNDELVVFANAREDVVGLDNGLSTLGEFEKDQEDVVEVDYGLASKMKEVEKALEGAVELENEVVSTVGGFKMKEKNVINVDDQPTTMSNFEKGVIKVDDRLSELIAFETPQKNVLDMNDRLLKSSIVRECNGDSDCKH